MTDMKKALAAINQRDNSKLQSGYVSRIKGTGLEKPAMVMGYSEQVKDGDKTYTVTVKNYVWKKGFIVPVGPYRKQDHETMIFIKDNSTGKTNAITYSHHERVYWSNVKQGKDGDYSVKMPTSWHTPILESGTYEKKAFGGRKGHIGRATVEYTKGAQKFAEWTQKLRRHGSQELPEIVAAVPINMKNRTYHDVKTAFTHPSELYNSIESLGAKPDSRYGKK